MTKAHNEAAAPAGPRNGGGMLGNEPSQAVPTYRSPRGAASEIPGLRAWAARRAARLADEFAQQDICEGDCGDFFKAACERERLLAVLRSAAEPAFRARLELDGRGGTA